jgi:peptidoglycan hydrolase CwlO-like protein
MKKLLAIIVSVAMLVSCIPMTVFADPVEPNPAPQAQEDEDFKIVYELVTKIISSPEFQKSYKDADAFLEKYQQDIENVQTFAYNFMNDKDFRMHYTDYLDNMIGDLEHLLVLLAKETDADLQELKAQIEQIRNDLVAIRDELVKLINEFPENIDAVQDAFRDAVAKKSGSTVQQS